MKNQQVVSTRLFTRLPSTTCKQTARPVMEHNTGPDSTEESSHCQSQQISHEKPEVVGETDFATEAEGEGDLVRQQAGTGAA